MHFEDPILKQDGTFVTYLDVALLKMAKLLATAFVDDDEDTYTPALKRMFRVVIIYLYALGGVFFAYRQFGLLVYVVLLGSSILMISQLDEVPCSATVTVKESQVAKIGFFLILSTPVASYPLLAKVLYGLWNIPSSALGLILVGVTYMCFLLAYVRRLGEPPKRKERKPRRLNQRCTPSE